ncbi:ring-cleaving dioxygenase [Erysipelothrix urinaevulpis]|uniref:ring-cleaving dioxygenase n=1 Tax=Erysipelothrix urinaevulpis TaxID=2683717 RepID=UPI00135CD31A|nr:ring-cleaving dioxygenase [Erysipelothrix urinaevulpis]
MKQLRGIHHITAITSDAKRIYDFYTNVLGIRLVKKNVNQDDINTYHLFFADDKGSPGTDMTFFDFKNIPQHVQGTNDISRSTFRVKDDESLNYWLKRFDHYDVKHSDIKHLFNKKFILFEDFDQQQYALVSDENNHGVAPGEPWYKGPVPNEFAIIGLGPVFLTVQSLSLMDTALTSLLHMTKISQEDDFHLYEMHTGGNGAEVIVEEKTDAPQAQQGYGGVHHVAFRVNDLEELYWWQDHFDTKNLRNSGYVDRFYFKSLYIRLYPNILFELATDGPGFIDDQESYEILGETLTLPPHLRHHQQHVEDTLKPFDSVRSNKVYEKEYFK